MSSPEAATKMARRQTIMPFARASFAMSVDEDMQNRDAAKKQEWGIVADACVNTNREVRRWSVARRPSAWQLDEAQDDSFASKSGASASDPNEEEEYDLILDEEPNDNEDRNEMVMRVLTKAPDQRSEDDLALLQQATEDVKFFERLTPIQYKQLCRVMTHERLDREQVVFTQGEEGTTFYIIHWGAAKVYVSDADTLPPGQCVCVLEDGDSFGELALHGNGIRNASVVTATSTLLLKVELEDYQQSLLQMHEADLQERIEFLSRIFIFSDWPESDLRKVAYVMTSRKFEKNTTIIRQGTQTDSMYFLAEGVCRVLQNVPLTARQHEMLGGKSSRQRSGGGESSPKSEQLLEVCRLNQYQYFGELALLDKGDHTASVVSTSAVEVYVLSKYDFYHHVDARTQEMMQNYAKKFYLDGASIRQEISKQYRWNEYKKNLLDGVVANVPGRAARGRT